MASSAKVLSLSGVNANIKALEYAVRGPLVIRANEIEKQLKQGAKFPFPNVIKANIGDAHAMGQQPLTYVRQVIALCTYPKLFADDKFPKDLKAKAKQILSGCGGGSLGAYSNADGIELVRQDVAEFIQKRDGIPSSADNVLLSGGASEIIKNLMSMFIPVGLPKPVAIMTPIPQYPLYSATISEYGFTLAGYYLDEESKWALDIAELKRSVDTARKTSDPKILVVINPGNPTGQVLRRENIEEIIKFAHAERLFIFADEVYQENVYDPESQFHSFKKVMTEMGPPYSNLELASFHSVSKGFYGECGMRGGYAEIINMDPDVMAMLRKALSARLCSTVTGQAVMDCVVNPPKPEEESYHLYIKEKNAVLGALKDKALLVEQSLNSIEGYKCNPVQGAMYAFPKLDLSDKVVSKAKTLNQQPDFFYAMQLLENTGVCVVPGSGFGQKPGTHHFRTTILPQPALMKDMMTRIQEYHGKFLKDFA